MSDMITAEAAAKLLDGTTPGPWTWGKEDWTAAWFLQPGVLILDSDGGGPSGVDEFDAANALLIAAAPDLARTVIALHAQLADAKAAQAMVVERAEHLTREIVALEALCDHDCYNEDCVRCFHYPEILEQKKAAIRALADPSGVEALAALRAERDRFEAALGRACLVGGTTYLVERAEKAEADRDRLAAANAALEAQVARLVGALTLAANRLQRLAVGYDTGTRMFIETSEWAEEARAEVQADARREGGE